MEEMEGMDDDPSIASEPDEFDEQGGDNIHCGVLECGEHHKVSSSSSSDSEPDSSSDELFSNDGNSSEDNVSVRSSDSGASDRVSENSELNNTDFSRSGEESEKTINLLFQDSHITVDEAILRILKLYIKERWTKTSLHQTVKVIKGLLPQPNDLPPSGVMLLNRLSEVAPFQNEIQHFYCSDCQLPWNNDSEACICGCKENDVFFEYPIEPQIKYLFEHRNLASVIDRHKNRSRKDSCISDIQDGVEYKRVKSELNGEYDIVLVLDTDGVSVSKSSKQEVWTLLTFICEVPPSLRACYMIVSGVYVGKKHPRMNTFMKPFAHSMKTIYDSGGVQWTHPDSEEVFCSQVVCPTLCADAPAKALVLNVRLFSHRYGCNICEQKSRKVALTAQQIALNHNLPPRKRKKPLRRFIFQEPSPLRTGPRMHLQGIMAEERQKSRKGVVGQTVACDMPFFDRAVCICAEYLHVVCLGVVKYFLNLMFFVRGPWYIGDKMPEIDEFLTSIKVPDFIKRLPRGMSDLKFLIGSELRALLLFYSLPAFEEHLPSVYFQHWMLLVGGIFILLQESISEEDLKAAEIMLRLFVREIHDLYGDKYYTYNVHNLLHLPLLVRRWGNLQVTSAFDFEKYNGFIVSHVHGTKHIGKEFLNNIKIIQSVIVFEGMVNAAKFLVQNRLPDFEICGQPLSKEQLSNAELHAISSENIVLFKLYGRVKVKSVLHTSKHYDQDKKRSNSYVQFQVVNSEEGILEYGQILYFAEDLENRKVVCIIQKFNVIHTKILFHLETRAKMRHLVPVEDSGEIAVLPIGCIVTKVIKAGCYLCLRPNSLEVNL